MKVLSEKNNMSSTERLQRIERMSSMDKARYEMIFMDFADTKPIQMRVNNLRTRIAVASGISSKRNQNSI